MDTRYREVVRELLTLATEAQFYAAREGIGFIAWECLGEWMFAAAAIGTDDVIPEPELIDMANQAHYEVHERLSIPAPRAPVD